jgi:hypothetical protein
MSSRKHDRGFSLARIRPIGVKNAAGEWVGEPYTQKEPAAREGGFSNQRALRNAARIFPPARGGDDD